MPKEGTRGAAAPPALSKGAEGARYDLLNSINSVRQSIRTKHKSSRNGHSKGQRGAITLLQ